MSAEEKRPAGGRDTASIRKKLELRNYHKTWETWREPYMEWSYENREQNYLKYKKCLDFEMPLANITQPANIQISSDKPYPSGIGGRVHGLDSPGKTPETTDNVNRGKQGGEDTDDDIELPWDELLIEPIAQSPNCRSSSLELPWSELLVPNTGRVMRSPSNKDTPCLPDRFEVPWDAIRIPHNIIIRPDKPIQQPSSRQPPRADRTEPAAPATICAVCKDPTCCSCNKTRAKVGGKVSTWTATSM